MQKALSTAALLVLLAGLLLITQGPGSGEAWRFYVGILLFIAFAALVVIPPIWLNRLAHGHHDTVSSAWRLMRREAPLELALVAVLTSGAVLAVMPASELATAAGLVAFTVAGLGAVVAAIYSNIFGYWMRDPERRGEG